MRDRTTLATAVAGIVGVVVLFDPLGLGLPANFIIQAVVALFSALLFLIELRRVTGYAERHTDREAETEWGLVAIVALLLVAMGNVVTAYATAVDADDARNFAGTMIRAVLLTVSLYLALSGPLRRR